MQLLEYDSLTSAHKIVNQRRVETLIVVLVSSSIPLSEEMKKDEKATNESNWKEQIMRNFYGLDRGKKLSSCFFISFFSFAFFHFNILIS